MQSEIFSFGKDVKVEDVGGGITRQIMGYNDDLMLVKAMFETGAEGYQHAHCRFGMVGIVSYLAAC